ncbi:hypothetical protein OAK35_01295 [Crocinitomicaceae bacterium]|nr:hypothetical protein [Crocinitomicaceae bacterium]
MNREEVELEVFDLLESKEFEELTGEEQSQVLTVMSQSEYQLQRRIMVEAGESEKLVAGPLVLPAKRSVIPIWFASIGSAAAAAILVFLLIEPVKEIEVNVQTTAPKIIRDTLIVENTVNDTIIDYRILKVEKELPLQEETAMIQVPEATSGTANVPPIREDELVNAGVSAANDNVIATFRMQPFIGM